MKSAEQNAGSAPQTRWGLIFFLFGAGVVAAFQIGKVPPALPDMRSDLDLSLFAASWVVSIFSLIGATCGVFIGALTDRAGHRKAILFGMFGIAAGNFAGAISQSEPVLLGSRFIEGVGYIVTAVAAPAMIAGLAGPADFRLAIGIWGSFMPVGMSVMMFIAPVILNRFEWQGLWHFNGVIALLIAFIFMAVKGRNTVKPLTIKTSTSKPWQDIAATLKRPGPLLLAAAMMTSSIQFMALMSFLPTFFIEECGMSQVKASLYTAITVAVNLTGTVAGGWLLQRGIPRWVLIAVSVGIISLSTFGIYSDRVEEGIRLILSLVFFGIHGIIPTVILAGAPVHAPSPALMGTVNGLIMQGSNMGHVIGPPILAAVVSASGGWQGVPWLYLVAASVCVIISLGLRISEKGRL